MKNSYFSDPRDHILLGETPTLMFPRFGAITEPLAVNKHRFVVGNQGIFIEARNPVLEVRLLIQPFNHSHKVSIPYGQPEASVRLVNGAIPESIFLQAFDASLASIPDEWAGLITWNVSLKRYELFEPEVINRSKSHIQYKSSLPDHLLLVVDLHSHGLGKAFFSATDDESEKQMVNSFYLAGCIGHCLRMDTLQIKTRFVINGNIVNTDWSCLLGNNLRPYCSEE